MTYSEVKAIMKKHNIHPVTYSIREDDKFHCKVETVECLIVKDGKYHCLTVNRGIVDFDKAFDHETDACKLFLKNMAYGHRSLMQYL